MALQERATAAALRPSPNISEKYMGITRCQEPNIQNRAYSYRAKGWVESDGTGHREQWCEDKEIKYRRGSPVGVEEDVDKGGGDGWQGFRVQREDTKAVLWALDGMYCWARPC